MSSFVNNPFALLSDDADVQAAAVPKKAAPLPEPKTLPKATPNGNHKKHNDRDGRLASAQRGRGGRASAPRAHREANSNDFTGGQGAPSDRSHQEPKHDRPHRNTARGNGRPNRRQFDRHSGTGRHDGEKKEVAGPSWGSPVESSGAVEGQTAEEALASTEEAANNNDWPSDSNVTEETAPVVTEPKKVEEEDKTKSYADYEKEYAARKAALKARPARRANEGVESTSLNSAQVLSKKDMTEEAGLMAMLLAGNKQKKKVERKQPKDRQVVTDLLKFQFTADYPRRPVRSARGDRAEGSDRPSRGGYRSPRSGGNSGVSTISKKLMAVNINDTMAFPSLA